MAGFCSGPCTFPFRDVNKFFGRGVPFHVAHAFHATADCKDSSSSWNSDATAAIGSATMDHFAKHWLGGEWCSVEEGQAMFETFVDAIVTAGVRPLNAIWVEAANEYTTTSVHDLGNSVLVVVSSPRFEAAGPAHEPPCVG